MLGAHQV